MGSYGILTLCGVPSVVIFCLVSAQRLVEHVKNTLQNTYHEWEDTTHCIQYAVIEVIELKSEVISDLHAHGLCNSPKQMPKESHYKRHWIGLTHRMWWRWWKRDAKGWIWEEKTVSELRIFIQLVEKDAKWLRLWMSFHGTTLMESDAKLGLI